MILVQLAGGLGNQMFQYAAARTVADRLGVPLGLDIRCCRPADSRKYALGSCALRASVIPDRDLRGLHAFRTLRWKLTAGVAERIGMWIRPAPLARCRRVLEVGDRPSDLLDRVTDDTWISGYWQFERYFEKDADRVRADLTVLELSREAAALEWQIRAMEYPVAVHVRRGDYALIASTRAWHGLCEVDYYRAAIDRINAEHPRATYVFFSDEPEWVTQNLGSSVDLLVSINGGTHPHEDLYLMTRCQAHIIANSTFSWWGAWLADSRRVIAPKRWLKGGPEERDPVPARWERL